METNQKGFSVLLGIAIIVAGALVGIGGYILFNQTAAQRSIGGAHNEIPVANNLMPVATSSAGTVVNSAATSTTLSTAVAAMGNSEFLGTYSYIDKYDNGTEDSGTLEVVRVINGEIVFNLSVFNYQAHFGDITEAVAKLNGNTAVYENQMEFRNEKCGFKINFDKSGATIEGIDGDNSCSACDFGMNVCADGVYVKKNGSTPEDYAKFANYVPSGWQILAKEDGDLNKDGISDAALVIEDAVEDNINLDWRYCADRKCGCAKTKNCARKLMLFFGKKIGGYELSLASDKAILLANEGGIYGDPFERLVIDNGVILLKFYGGSSWRWDNVFRFRYQNSGWYLIGKTAVSYYSGCSNEVFRSVDTNYLTGKVETVTGAGWADGDNIKPGFECGPYSVKQAGISSWVDSGVKNLIDLNNFNPRVN